MNIPTYFTLLRILLIPIFVIVYYLPMQSSSFCAAIIFFLAGATDWLDGFLARKLNMHSELGAFLDPVADKLLVAFALVMLAAEPSLRFIAIPCAIIICREIIISALREWMSELGKRTSVAVSYIGKVKTLIQMFAIFILLIYNSYNYFSLMIIGYCALYIAAILTLWSMAMYVQAAWPNISFDK